MPAYISMVLEFSRYELDFDNMKELAHYLDYAGLKFKGGAWGAENESFEDIMAWNQKKLEENFVLGTDESHENGYKQMIFDFDGFSEIKGVIENKTPAEKEFTFTLLIPEEEIFDNSGAYRQEAVEKLKTLAGTLWILPKVRTVQTIGETDDGIAAEENIKSGKAPKACPFAIISEKQFGHIELEGFSGEHIYAGGVLLMHKE